MTPIVLGKVCNAAQPVSWIARIEHLASMAAQGPQAQHFVQNAPLWPAVERAADDPVEMAALVAQVGSSTPGPGLNKLWAEAVFELVRRRDQVTAPSRLNCVFATEMGNGSYDVMDALAGPPPVFDPATGLRVSGKMILPATTEGPWIALDMCRFEMPQYLVDDPEVMCAAFDQLVARATRYWAGEMSDRGQIEFLCTGLNVEGWGAPSSVTDLI